MRIDWHGVVKVSIGVPGTPVYTYHTEHRKWRISVLSSSINSFNYHWNKSDSIGPVNVLVISIKF